MAKSDVQGFDLSTKSVAVIGCGGLGCNVAVHLAGAGVGRLLLCDFDTVSDTNLNRQFLYTPADISKKKTDVIKKRLSEYAPDVNIEIFDKKIVSENDLSFATRCDIIISALDNVPARKVIQEFCFANKIPFINGGIDGDYGLSYLCVPTLTPCLCCAGLTAEKTDVTAKSISSTAGITGAHCVFLAQKYLTEELSFAGRLFVFDGGEITSLKIKSKENCRFCGKK